MVITDTEGMWFIYFVGSTLTASQTPWVIEEDSKALVCVVYWDADNNEHVILGYELHTWVMDPGTHAVMHHAEGAKYSSGFALGNLTTDASGDVDSHAQFSVADGVFFDEDIKFSIADDSPQDLSTIADLPIIYRDGASGLWRKIAATQFPVNPAAAGSNRATWNEWTGATWQLTEADNNDFVLSHVFATNDVEEPVVVIMGQGEYNTLGLARTGAETEMQTLAFGDLAGLTPEFIPVATVIYQTSNGYSNAVHSRVRTTDEGDDYIDWRSSTGARGAVSGVTDHGALSGLADDDHTHYLLADGTRDLTGNLAVDALVTVDGRDISVDGTTLDGHGTVLAGLSASGVVVTDGSGNLDMSTLVDLAELNYLNGGTGNIQSQIDDKPDMYTPWLGGRAVFTSLTGGGRLHESDVTTAELGYLDGVTSDIQPQLDAKADESITLTAGTGLSGGGDLSTNRTFNLDINSLTEESGFASGDFIPFYDTTAGAIRKVDYDDLPSGGGSTKMQYNKIIYIEDPAATDSYPVFAVPTACTITRISHITDTGTVTWNMEERAAATPDVAGTDVYASDEVASAAQSVDTSFSNATLAQYSWLHYACTSVASSPTKLWIAVTFDED